jgi:hypothetical protein
MIDQMTRDKITADAQSFQTLIHGAEVFDPVMFNALTARVTSPTKSAGSAVLVAAVTWVSGKYGFGWDGETVSIAAGLVGIASGYAVHLIEILLYRTKVVAPALAAPTPPPAR